MKEGPDGKIADNPKTKEMRSVLPFFQLLASAAGFAAKVGIKREALTKFKSEVDELMAASSVLDLPDHFNAAFSDRGWIATGSFALDNMRMAVELQQNGETMEAENIILDWFTEENIRQFIINPARRYHIAQLRSEQLEEALSLYEEERYMAAVPLILIAADGFASDVSGTSPFEKNADLTCFDSIAGHQTSLPALMRLLIQGVRKSTDEELTLPKRHGILHGRSLGYANKTVCAKAWLLMLALVDWAIDKESEKSRIEEYRKSEATSFRDVLERSKRTQENKSAIEAFQPSEAEGPFAGPHGENTPLYAVLEFLEGWKKKNYGRMAKHAVNLTRKPLSRMAGEMRDMAEFVVLEDYEINRIRYSTVARCDVRIHAHAKTPTKTVGGEFDLLLIRYTLDRDIAMPTDQGCVWAVQQSCIYNVMNEKFADQS